MQKSMFEIKCANCGKAGLVPFKPVAGKPVYCQTCFSKNKSIVPKNSNTTNSFDPNQAWARRR